MNPDISISETMIIVIKTYQCRKRTKIDLVDIIYLGMEPDQEYCIRFNPDY